MKKFFVIVVLSMLFLVLVYSVLEMPEFATENSPAYNELARYYIENAVEEAHATNAIAAIITDFRAFDTMGETTVLFTAILAVTSVLKQGKGKKHE
mgnify:CR=1 FL=1